jgi:trimeric autotransporter adhesin
MNAEPFLGFYRTPMEAGRKQCCLNRIRTMKTITKALTTTAALEALSGTAGSRLATLESSVGALDGRNELYNRQANGGIAAAMAMGGTIIPADANGAMSFNLSTYRGQQGFSGVIVQRVAPKVYFNAGIAGSTVRGSTGGRVGVTIGW